MDKFSELGDRLVGYVTLFGLGFVVAVLVFGV
jgi:hypothetical protein